MFIKSTKRPDQYKSLSIWTDRYGYIHCKVTHSISRRNTKNRCYKPQSDYAIDTVMKFVNSPNGSMEISLDEGYLTITKHYFINHEFTVFMESVNKPYIQP